MGTELPEVISYTLSSHCPSQVLIGGRSFNPSVRCPGVTVSRRKFFVRRANAKRDPSVLG